MCNASVYRERKCSSLGAHTDVCVCVCVCIRERERERDSVTFGVLAINAELALLLVEVGLIIL